MTGVENELRELMARRTASLVTESIDRYPAVRRRAARMRRTRQAAGTASLAVVVGLGATVVPGALNGESEPVRPAAAAAVASWEARGGLRGDELVEETALDGWYAETGGGTGTELLYAGSLKVDGKGKALRVVAFRARSNEGRDVVVFTAGSGPKNEQLALLAEIPAPAEPVWQLSLAIPREDFVAVRDGGRAILITTPSSPMVYGLDGLVASASPAPSWSPAQVEGDGVVLVLGTPNTDRAEILAAGQSRFADLRDGAALVSVDEMRGARVRMHDGGAPVSDEPVTAKYGEVTR